MKHQHFKNGAMTLNIPAESLESARQYIKERLKFTDAEISELVYLGESYNYKSYANVANLHDKSNK